MLRKAAVSCLRQLSQREAKEVCEHALTLANENRENNNDGIHFFYFVYLICYLFIYYFYIIIFKKISRILIVL